jgi:Rrf2 family protein
MFKLSKKTEYSIVALRHLAGRSSQMATVKEIAETCKIPQPLLAKLLQQLAKKDVLRSVQGVNGGYRLNKEAGQISVADILEAIEGPVSITACGVQGHSCERLSICDLRSTMAPLQQEMLLYLRSVSLADL